MMRNGVVVLAGIILFWVNGCASRNAGTTAVSKSPEPAHFPDDPAYFTLDQIKPVPVLAAPASRPAGAQPVPLDALQWYAEAHAALASGDRAAAVSLLERAVNLDSDSPEIYEELGQAYGAQDKALAAYERSLTLNPDNLELQERLGRRYLIANKPDQAMLHFRLALQTTDYQRDNEAAAVVDFFLARALQRKGYDRAALDRYALLVKRLDSSALSSRSNPELLSLLSQPEILYGQIGELYEKHKEYDEAAHAYELAVERTPDNFEFQSKLAHVLADAGKAEEAQKRSAELVTRFHANPDSLKLLRDIYQQLGKADQLIGALTTLRRQHPADPSLLYALADAYKQAGRMPEAEKLLLDQAKNGGNSEEIVRRLFNMYDERDDVPGAARLLVNALAANPDCLWQLSPLWTELVRPSRHARLRLPVLQKMKVAPEAEASRLFFISRLGAAWDRDAIARSALEQGAALAPAFAPIYRTLIVDDWLRPDWNEDQKITECSKLAQTVRQQGNPALAAELEALSLIQQKDKTDQAQAKLEESIRLGNKSPDVQLRHAIVLSRAGNTARAEQLLWKIVSDAPGYEDGYLALYDLQLDQNQAIKAVNVLSKWIAADPTSVQARLHRAALMLQAGRFNAAETDLLALFQEQPENPEVLAALYTFYSREHRIEEYISKLEAERKAHPQNRQAVEQLVLIYYADKRIPEALRALDAARQAVASDPDLLYYIAHIYGQIDQKETEEKVLEDVIRLDPHHASASNDLGYTWADEGKNLQQAEELIRLAVDAEPDNQSFLDSLGWVLYKRAKFSEAVRYFEKAIGPSTRPDPVVLDHMGDALYRLSQSTDAAKQWRRAQQRLDETQSSREDLKNLRLQLMEKLRQQERGKPVDVAPTAVPIEPATQAKN